MSWKLLFPAKRSLANYCITKLEFRNEEGLDRIREKTKTKANRLLRRPATAGLLAIVIYLTCSHTVETDLFLNKTDKEFLVQSPKTFKYPNFL